MYEVESKFKDEKGNFISFLKNQPCIFTIESCDVYYDVENSFDLFLKGYFIRLRSEGGKNVLEFKFDTPEMNAGNTHDFCLEKSFNLEEMNKVLPKVKKVGSMLGLKWRDDIKDINDFYKVNNLKMFVKICKARKMYKISNNRIFWDSVEKLGDFIEIEALENKKEDIPKRIREIETFASKFELKRIRTGYVELYLKKFNPILYEKGRFKDAS